MGGGWREDEARGGRREGGARGRTTRGRQTTGRAKPRCVALIRCCRHSHPPYHPYYRSHCLAQEAVPITHAVPASVAGAPPWLLPPALSPCRCCHAPTMFFFANSPPPTPASAPPSPPRRHVVSFFCSFPLSFLTRARE